MGNWVQPYHNLKPEAQATVEEKLASIQNLLHSPFDSSCTRGLLNALEDNNHQVRQAALSALMERFQVLGESDLQDKHIAQILSYCFIESHDGVELPTKKYLFHQLIDFLFAHRRSSEHHLNRLLYISRYILQINQSDHLVEEIRWFEKRLRKEPDRIASKVYQALYQERRNHAYQSPDTPIETLLGYLKEDTSTSFEEMDSNWFYLYMDLLTQQEKKEKEHIAIKKKALENLLYWLKQLPREISQWQEHGRTLRDAASKGYQPENLPQLLQKHLAVHAALLREEGGKNILQLMENWVAPQAQELLILCFQILGHLPALARNRQLIEGIYQFLESPKMDKQPWEVWQAVFTMIKQLFVALPPEHSMEEDIASSNTKRRSRVFRQQQLVMDERMRQLLYNIAHRHTIDPNIREQAWKTLLEMVPPERLTYYQEALQSGEHEFFLPSIEMAGRTHQREIWNLLEENWQAVTSSKENFTQICQALVPLANFPMVPPLIAKGMDDPDLEIREIARETLIAAGYEKEWQREKTKREILSLTDQKEKTDRRLEEIDREQAELIDVANSLRGQRNEIEHEMQVLQQEREILTSRGYVNTSQIQARLQELRVVLYAAMQKAQEKREEVQRFLNEMEDCIDDYQRAESSLERIVRRQEERERDRDRLERERQRAQQERDNTARQRRNLENNPPQEPREPSYSSDPETRERQQRDFSRALARHERAMQSWHNKCAALEREISHCENRERNLQHEKEMAVNDIQNLEREAQEARENSRYLDNRLREIDSRYRQAQHSWREVQAEINSLSRQIDQVEQEREQARESLAGKLQQNTQAYYQQRKALQEIDSKLHKVTQQSIQLDREKQDKMTLSQTLTQEIATHRVHYEQLGQEAEVESSTTDRQAQAKKQEFMDHQKTAEQFRFWYGYDMHRMLRTHNPQKRSREI